MMGRKGIALGLAAVVLVLLAGEIRELGANPTGAVRAQAGSWVLMRDRKVVSEDHPWLEVRSSEGRESIQCTGCCAT